VHEVTLAPYFLSKYELTQGQWERFTGSNPSQYGAHNFNTDWNAAGRAADLLHPVEQVDWNDCTEVMSRLGVALPTEAQWERAARAGTGTPWWTGDEAESLEGAANLADSYGKQHGASAWMAWDQWLDDGSTVHAAVGSYRPNAFGLHEVHGNVWEWCRDGYGGYNLPVGKEDTERLVAGPRDRVFRGGGFNVVAANARSANRSITAPGYRDLGLGLRPARRIATPLSEKY